MPNPVKSILKTLYYSRTFNRQAVKLYSLVYPHPYRSHNMEFYHDIWNGISSLHGEQGRQIGENNTGPEEYKEIIDTVHNPCKFEGSRNGLLINMTALRHVMAVWDDALQLTTLLRDDFIRYRQLSNKRLNLPQGYVFSKIGAALPAFLVRRQQQPLKDGELPPLETAFFTLGVGVFMVVRALMEKGDLTALDRQPMSAERLYELADSSGALVTPAGKGCAGSKKLIIEFLDVAMNGSYDIDQPSAEASRCFNSLGDMPTFYRYLFSASRLELYVKLNQYLCALSLLSLSENVDSLTEVEQLAVSNSLEYFIQQFGQRLTDTEIISNMIQIVLVLLQELDDEQLLQQLTDNGFLLPAADSQTGVRLTMASDRQDAVQRIARITGLMHDHCQSELKQMNDALGLSSAPSVSLDEMYHRACGPYIQSLLA